MTSLASTNVVPFQTTALFCKQCGMLLKLESANPRVQCKFCHATTNIDALEETTTETTVTLQHRKEWMRDASEEKNSKKPTVEQDCPECDNNLTYYRTAQTRSVDEGQTVYYECTKCGHTFTDNT